MIVTSHDLTSGLIALLPPGWEEQHGSVEYALDALKASIETAKRPKDVPPLAVAFGADTTLGVLAHAKVLRVRGRTRLLESDGGPEGLPRVIEAEIDYDVVHRPSGTTIVQVRHRTAAQRELSAELDARASSPTAAG